MIKKPVIGEENASKCFGDHPTENIKVKITKETPGFKIGEEVTIKFYGTFGGWSTDGRWVSFYSSEQMLMEGII